jgi:hypothetical protein
MMLHKFRRAMVKSTREPLWGEVEVDDTSSPTQGSKVGIGFSRAVKPASSKPAKLLRPSVFCLRNPSRVALLKSGITSMRTPGGSASTFNGD